VHLVTLPRYDVCKYEPPENVYGVLAAPPCTKFSKADTSKTRLEKDFSEGMRTVEACLKIIWKLQMQGAPLQFWALENPQGYLSRFLGRSAYRFQHWEFGETNSALATKRTELWGYFNSPPRTVRNRTLPPVRKGANSDWSRLSAEERAVTNPGFAKAFFEANT
jgi:hypothetical protein